MPKVSVIVPVYNVERYLPHCLDSILAQTHADLEVVCVNDGSTDRSGQILGLYAARDPRVHVISIANEGVSHARNVGIEAATGDVIEFVDSDDLLLPDACERACSLLERHGADIVKFSAELYPKAASNFWFETMLTLDERVFEGFSTELVFDAHTRPFLWNGAYRADFLRKNAIRFREGLTMGEDQAFSFATLARSSRTVLVPDRLYCYRLQRAGSAMASSSQDRVAYLAKHQGVVSAILSDWGSLGLMEGEPGAAMLRFVAEFILVDICELDGASGKDSLLRGIKDVLRSHLGRAEVASLAPEGALREALLRAYDYDGDAASWDLPFRDKIHVALYGPEPVPAPEPEAEPAGFVGRLAHGASRRLQARRERREAELAARRLAEREAAIAAADERSYQDALAALGAAEDGNPGTGR